MTLPHHDSHLDTDQAFESLFAAAAPRHRPPVEDTMEVREAIFEVWQNQVKTRLRRRRGLLMAAASIVLFALVINFAPRLMPNSVPIAVAEVGKQFGEISVVESDKGTTGDGRDSVITVGQIVQTGVDSGMALTWHDGGSLRLDQGTRVAFTSADEIYLHAGRLYFDSAKTTQPNTASRANGMEVLSIRTDRGVVVPLGTRYTTEMHNSALRVSVREGRVSVRQAAKSSAAQAGYQLTVLQNGDETLKSIPVYGEEWTWIERTTPAFDTEGRSIYEFLEWVSRETGKSLQFTSVRAEAAARSGAIIGYGRVDLEPSAALRMVMLTTDLFWRQDNGIIYVSDKPEPGQI